MSNFKDNFVELDIKLEPESLSSNKETSWSLQVKYSSLNLYYSVESQKV